MLQRMVADQQRSLEQEEDALREEVETVQQLQSDLTRSIERRTGIEAATTQAQEALRTEMNELAKTQFLLEARQVKLVSDLQSIYPITVRLHR